MALQISMRQLVQDSVEAACGTSSVVLQNAVVHVQIECCFHCLDLLFLGQFEISVIYASLPRSKAFRRPPEASGTRIGSWRRTVSIV